VPIAPVSRWIAAACLFTATILLAACPARQSIESINRDPARYRDHEVTIAGRVVNSFDVMGVAAFEIDDGTGRLWVYSNKFGVPGKESKVAVTGTIQQGLSLGGRNFAMILRETRPHHE
jgi:hypothetical protein